MTTAFVLGNGQSRMGLPLHDLQQRGPIYGCNALYRDFTPNVLVATDRPIAQCIEASGYALKNQFYTRRPGENTGSLIIPKPYFGYSSGPVAVALASLDHNKKIYLLGFDMGPTENKKFNNLYAGTEFYKEQESSPTYTGNWIRQIQHICREFPAVNYIRVCGKNTARLSELDAITNLQHLPLERFIERINNLKDL
jgi:hypothetical protein